MKYFSVGIPVWSCQLYILGGVRRMASVAVIYALLLLGASILWMRVNGGLTGGAVQDILRLLASVQCGLVVFGGAGALHRALQRDHANRMIDTLRTSPMSAWTVLCGYLVGGTLQILTLFGVDVIFGALLARLGGSSTQWTSWLAGNLSLLLAGVSLWMLVAFFGLGLGKPTNVMPLLVVLGVTCSLWFRILPGLGLFSGAFAVLSSWYVMLERMNVPKAFGFELAAAGGLTLFWGFAAARRYRKPWLPALDPAAALILVGLAIACGVGAFILQDGLLPSNWRVNNELEALFYGALLAPLLFLHLPASMAVQTRRRLAFGARADRSHDRWPPTLWALLSATVAIGGALMLASPVARRASAGLLPAVRDAEWPAWAVVACAYLAATLLSCALVKWTYFSTGRTSLAIVGAYMLWGAPPLVEFIRGIALADARGEVERLSWFFGCSPVGTILAAWQAPPDAIPVVPGLAVQFGLVPAAFLLARRAEQTVRKKRVELLAAENSAALAQVG